MKPMTVNQLLVACQDQVKMGNGNKHIAISSDDEGNEFHDLFFEFLIPDNNIPYYGCMNLDEIITLG